LLLGLRSAPTTISAAEEYCEGRPQGEEPSRPVIPARGPFAPSQPYADGLLLTPYESKAGSTSGHHGHGTQIAVIFYTMIRKQAEYDETLWAVQDNEQKKRLEIKLRRQAHLFGYQLVPAPAIS
jgi:hypothetical protein